VVIKCLQFPVYIYVYEQYSISHPTQQHQVQTAARGLKHATQWYIQPKALFVLCEKEFMSVNYRATLQESKLMGTSQ